MTRAAIAAIIVAILAAVAEVVLSFAAMTPPLLWLAIVMPFLVGPLLFIALLAWRRRTHPGRSRLLLAVTVVVAAVGVGILGIDYVRLLFQPGRQPLSWNPVILPLAQWGTVLVVWLGLVIQEGREKRAAKKST